MMKIGRKTSVLYSDALVEITHEEIVLKHRGLLGRKHLRWNGIHSIAVCAKNEAARRTVLPFAFSPFAFLSLARDAKIAPNAVAPNAVAPNAVAPNAVAHSEKVFVVNLLHSRETASFTAENCALVESILRCNTRLIC